MSRPWVRCLGHERDAGVQLKHLALLGKWRGRTCCSLDAGDELNTLNLWCAGSYLCSNVFSGCDVFPFSGLQSERGN